MKVCIIELDESTIRNHRIYFPRVEGVFFPMDSLSERAGDEPDTKLLTFQAGSRTIETSIRKKSGSLLSPRRSFGPFLKEIDARAGDELEVERVGDREYVVRLARASGSSATGELSR